MVMNSQLLAEGPESFAYLCSSWLLGETRLGETHLS